MHANLRMFIYIKPTSIVENPNRIPYKEYKENGEVAKTYRRDLCDTQKLVHIRPQHINDAWLTTMGEARKDNDKLTEFLNYYMEQRIENHTITHSIWNILEPVASHKQ